MMFINMCNCHYNKWLEKVNWNLFNINLVSWENFSYKDRITLRYGAYLEKFGIQNYSIEYDIYINEERENRIKNYYNHLNNEILNENKESKGFLILNPYGASKHKNFDFQTLNSILRYLSEKGYTTIIIYLPDKFKELKEFYNKIKDEMRNVLLPEWSKSILDSALLIKYVEYVITPDTWLFNCFYI